MRIDSNINEYNNYDLDITKNDIVLSIYQAEGSFYIACKYTNYKSVSDIDFNITEDDPIYSVMDHLYTSIVETNNSEESHKSIVENGIITIYSDSYSLKDTNILYISKQDSIITFSFNKIERKEVFKPASTIFIKIKENNSRSEDFPIVFQETFNELQKLLSNNSKTRIRK